MDNSYLVYTSDEQITLERFHICTWEFSNNSSLVEFGCEILAENLTNKKDLKVEMYVPWINKSSTLKDFYPKLIDTSNSRFIFNDSIIGFTSLDGGNNRNGIIHEFSGKEKLCILPISFINDLDNNKLTININLDSYNKSFEKSDQHLPNIYFRFCVSPNKTKIANVKKGITKSTILYDIKLNQPRNIPDTLSSEISRKYLSNVVNCFCINIIPNTHDLVFFDNTSLKNVRTLEYNSFKKYLGSELLIEEDLIVVFNKKSNMVNYSFFNIYTKELIGSDQIAVALLINLLAGILLFKASLDTSLTETHKDFVIGKMPASFWLVLLLFFAMIIYLLHKSYNFSIKKIKKFK